MPEACDRAPAPPTPEIWGSAGQAAGMTSDEPCMLCAPEIADREFDRVRLWEDELWRLSAVLRGPIPGFAHLKPRRHIRHITDLDGAEAATFGPVLARVTRALRDATGAELTYACVFGDHVSHLHVNLAPHRAGDALQGGPGLLAPDAADAPSQVHAATADAVRGLLGG
jgi:diadenosine tetraphosphate (Ap4A) HIT family hydrolase